jgi:hypothetical protein
MAGNTWLEQVATQKKSMLYQAHLFKKGMAALSPQSQNRQRAAT